MQIYDAFDQINGHYRNIYFEDKIFELSTSLKVMKAENSPYDNIVFENKALGGFYNIIKADILVPVASIGDNLFYGCRNLKTINIPDSLIYEAFEKRMYAGTGIESIVIPIVRV